MTCSRKFIQQCKHWQAYGVVSLAIMLFSFALLSHSNFTGWELVAKVFVVWGTITCVVWWIWIMKKTYDIATWWFELHNNLDTATQLLHETKADIRDIKNLSAPAR